MQFLIRYNYPGTVNGKPVGDVYITGPHFGSRFIGGTYSYTLKVADASKYTRAAAEELALYRERKSMRDHVIVAEDAATDLG